MAQIEIVEWLGDIIGEATYFGQLYEPAVGTILELGTDEVRVGRGPDADLILPVGNVSRLHFRLFRQDGHLVYEDLGSLQQPVFNGKLIHHRQQCVLGNGDTFNAAGIYFRFQDG